MISNRAGSKGVDSNCAVSPDTATKPGTANRPGVANSGGESLLVMSLRAKESLEEYQLERLESYCSIVAPSLTVIENNGGGSARCMIAELYVG